MPEKLGVPVTSKNIAEGICIAPDRNQRTRMIIKGIPIKSGRFFELVANLASQTGQPLNV